jgi:hypothetical protein
LLLPVGVTELDLGEGGTTTGVVDNLLDDSTDVTGTLGEVKGAQLGGALAQTSVRLEDSSGTLTLSTNDTTHFSIDFDCLDCGPKELVGVLSFDPVGVHMNWDQRFFARRSILGDCQINISQFCMQSARTVFENNFYL